MTQISLADLIIRRVALAPREAAVLTLAVAREWRRQRTLYGPVALPDVAAIRLEASGAISFLVMPHAGADDEAATLSTLFARLLGDDPQVPRPLMCSSDDDPATLRAIFWRYASETRIERRGRRHSHQQRRMSRRERRAGAPGEAVMELRRSIRLLEQQVFESQRAPRGPMFLARRTSRRTKQILVAVSLLILVVGGLSAMPARTPTPLPVRATPVATHIVERAVAEPRAPAPQHRSPTRTRVRRPRPLPVSARVEPSSALAGGTRGIVWMNAAR